VFEVTVGLLRTELVILLGYKIKLGLGYGTWDRERYNARNNARFTQARKTTHGLDGQHGHDCPWKSQSE